MVTFAHPGGNVTGMSALAADMATKRVELLKELIPSAARVVVPGLDVNSLLKGLR